MDIYGIKDFPEIRIGGTIKNSPEDFIVEEVTPAGRTCRVKTGLLERIVDFFPKKFNEQLHFTLVKRSYTTQRAINQIASKLRISSRRFGYAGTKDRRAVTAQRISVWNTKVEDLKKVKLKDIEIKNFGYSKERLTLGDLKSNIFTIIIKDIELPEEEIRKRVERFEEEIALGVPNYFGPQRFGIQRPTNYYVGRQLLLGNFEEAAKIFLTKQGDENPESAEARLFASNNWGNWGEILRQWPRHLGIEAAILNYLVKYPTDYANAFRRLPKNLRRMFIHAVQSYIFNLVLTKIIEEKKEYPQTIPLVGYDTNLENSIGSMLKEALKNEGLKKELFRLEKMPEIKEPGSERETTIEIKSFKVIEIKKNSLKISFELGKGSYATVLLKMLLGGYYE